VDSRLQRADSDFRNWGPRQRSVSASRWLLPQEQAKLEVRVMRRALAFAQELQLDLPALAFSTPNREG
jgi:hypothetical protein